MYVYEKRLQYPVNIKCRNPKMAQVIISQYGGPDGEASAAMRYICLLYTSHSFCSFLLLTYFSANFLWSYHKKKDTSPNILF